MLEVNINPKMYKALEAKANEAGMNVYMYVRYLIKNAVE